MLCDFRLCRKMNARIWHQSWTLKTLSRTAKTKQVTTLQPFQSSCRVRKVASITRSDGLHSCDVWHGLQKPTSSCLQIDVTDSNLVQVLKDRNKEPFVGSTEIWTRIAGFRPESRVLTITPWNPTTLLWLCNSWNLLLYDNAYLFACVNVVNSWKSVAAFLSILSHGSVGGVVASIAAFQAVDLGSIPGRRKEVSGGLHFIRGDLVTPLIDVISPRLVAKPSSSQQWFLNPANIF